MRASRNTQDCTRGAGKYHTPADIERGLDWLESRGRRFLIHVLPSGFHRIRHYGLFANGSRADNIARARELLNVPTPQQQTSDAKAANPDQPPALSRPPCCGGRMIIIETFEPGATPRYRPSAPTPAIRIDTS
jgi:hypothetical protein